MHSSKKLLSFLKSLPVDQSDRDTFAEKCGTSWAYLKQVSYGNKACQAWLAVNLERESKGTLKCEEICSENVDWAYIRAAAPPEPINPSVEKDVTA
jgi:DNA-binding transcriptional regulator YdaS (Cro superfamily)